jgi:hypothetical protein
LPCDNKLATAAMVPGGWRVLEVFRGEMMREVQLRSTMATRRDARA